MGIYRVTVKESVFRETPLREDEFSDDLELVFESKKTAQEWLDTQNERHSRPGTLTFHSAHPTNSSGVDAYLVFQPGTVWTVDS
jgi:hypothetical protein